MSLNYEAIRPRTEFLNFKLTSDLQPVLTDPDEPASLDTETVTLSGCDVGAPIQNVLSWFSLTSAGGWSGLVPIGTFVASTKKFVGPTLYAVAMASTGGVGGAEPVWNDILGTEVIDGDVTWAMLGTSLQSDYPQWQSVQYSEVQVGTIIKAMNYLPSAVDLSGVPIPAPASSIQSFQLCTQSGVTQYYTNSLNTGLADLDPGHPEPLFSATAGVVTNDGTVQWTSLGDGGGSINIPLGMDLSRRSFFPSDRGQQSIQYLINVARARLLLRSRCATVTFPCKFERAIQLSCRMGGILNDHRMPNGQVQGKVTRYSFSVNKEGPGVIIGSVTLAGSIGFGAVTITDPGTGVYTDTDYMEPGYQYMDGEIVYVSSEDQDVAYTPPAAGLNDDGIVFPITDKNQIIVKEQVLTPSPPTVVSDGSTGGPDVITSIEPLTQSVSTLDAAGKLPGAAAFLPNTFYTWIEQISSNPSIGVQELTTIVKYINLPNGYAPVEVPIDMQQTLPFWGAAPSTGYTTVFYYPVTQYYLELKPLQGVSFSDQYNIVTSLLSVPAMVTL